MATDDGKPILLLELRRKLRNQRYPVAWHSPKSKMTRIMGGRSLIDGKLQNEAFAVILVFMQELVPKRGAKKAARKRQAPARGATTARRLRSPAPVERIDGVVIPEDVSRDVEREWAQWFGRGR